MSESAEEGRQLVHARTDQLAQGIGLRGSLTNGTEPLPLPGLRIVGPIVSNSRLEGFGAMATQ